MDRLKALWDYQTAELEYEEFEAALKNTETRKKLVQHQKFLQGKQQLLKNIENDASIMESKLKDIGTQIDKLCAEMEKKKHELTEFEDSDPEDIFLEDVKETIRECEGIKASIEQNKRKVVEIKHKLEKSNEDVMQTLKNMSVSKKEFDRLKEIHNKELEKGADDTERLKAAVKSAAKNVEPELMEKYKKIKARRANPIAKLNGDRCSGCNMQLPYSVISELKGGKIVECDSCGRILYI